jgi:hypothetical protein
MGFELRKTEIISRLSRSFALPVMGFLLLFVLWQLGGVAATMPIPI